MSRSAPVTPDGTSTLTTFGDLLCYLRQRAQLTQRDLALAAGYSISQISRLEHNERLPNEMIPLGFARRETPTPLSAFPVHSGNSPCTTPV